MRVAALFAGIGGIELGLHQAGHRTVLFCESDPGAARVLKRRFSTDVSPDVRDLETLGDIDLVTAG
ncbi:MAG TPA: DNA cytosine methyltransferase, partial [Candidatus Limnocylindrales bacterium]|nr:DNA cytosine methyltransferase [Candidatus Limnocylindrales bacterium]